MRRHLFSSVAALALFAGGSAFAADLGARMPMKAPPMVAPVWSWSGFYIGGHAGYGFGSDSDIVTTGIDPVNVTNVAIGARPGRVNLDEREGFVGGGQIGYNWQNGAFVFGIEADISYTDISDEANFITNIGGVLRSNVFGQELEYLGTVRGRIGFAADRTLFYATGGFAYGGVKTAAAFFTPAGALQFAGATDDTETGYTVGGGIEHAFSPNWTIKAEYLYYDLGDTTAAVLVVPPFTAGGAGGVGAGYLSTFDNSGHIIRAGLNYKFGGNW